MYTDEIALHKQIDAHKMRLRILEERAALQGINAPPETLIEITGIKEKIANLEKEIANLSNRKYLEYSSDVDLKHYVYVSSKAINALYSKLPDEFKTDSKVATRRLKLRSIFQYMEKGNIFGDLDNPGEYIRGIMSGKRCYFRGFSLFMCSAPYITVLLIGGGGNSLDLKHPVSNLGEYELNEHMNFALNNLYNLDVYNSDLTGYELNEINMEIAYRLRRIFELLNNPIEQLEFFAKTLNYDIDNDEDTLILLGAPLYVALAD
jgi:hypothetical protein